MKKTEWYAVLLAGIEMTGQGFLICLPSKTAFYCVTEKQRTDY